MRRMIANKEHIFPNEHLMTILVVTYVVNQMMWVLATTP